MSFNITEDADYLGGIDYSDLTRIGKFQNALVITNQIQANATEEFQADESDDIVKSIEKQNPDAPLPGFARLIDVKINVRGNSSNLDIEIFQSESYREIDRVVRISQESVSATPNNFTLGAGIGVPYVEKDGGNQIYFRVEENSGSTCEVDIEFNWLNIRE